MLPVINHRQMREFFKLACEADEPMLVVSRPGHGKTESVYDFAKENNYHVVLSTPVLDDISKYGGYPTKTQVEVKRKFIDFDSIENGIEDIFNFDFSEGGGENKPQIIDAATHLPYDEIIKILTACEPTIWFIDELGNSTDRVQAALMQALQARRLAGHKIPDCIRILAATNAREHGTGVKALLEAVKDRFAMIFELRTTAEDFSIWAAIHNLYQPVIDFILAYPSALDDFELGRGMEKNTSPRTWAKLAKLLSCGGKDMPDTVKAPMIRHLCCAAIGEKWGSQFAGHIAFQKHMPAIEDIIADPENFPIDHKADERFAILNMLASKGELNDSKAIFTYVEKMKKEFMVVFIQQLKARKSPLCKSREYVSWLAANMDVYIG